MQKLNDTISEALLLSFKPTHTFASTDNITNTNVGHAIGGHCEVLLSSREVTVKCCCPVERSLVTLCGSDTLTDCVTHADLQVRYRGLGGSGP